MSSSPSHRRARARPPALARALPVVAAILGAACAARPGARADRPAGGALRVAGYHVVVAPDPETRTIAASTTLRIASLGGADALRFPVEGVTVDRVSTAGGAIPFTQREGTLTIAARALVPAALPVDVTVAYHGSPPRSLVWGARSVHTTFFSCGWMICEPDRPDDRAPLVLEILVPEGLQVVASGEEAGTTAAGPGLVRHAWRQDRPYPTYLFGFAVGRFDRVALPSRPPGVDVVAEDARPEVLARMFADAEAMRTFFEDRAGVPLPQRYTQVLVGGEEAQEASSFALLGRASVEPLLDDPRDDWVVAHELAHQWWGNLVTCASWEHLWLNEGVTVLMVAAWKERRWGRAEYDRELEVARTRWQRAIESGLDVPLAWAGAYPSLRLKRAITYSKAALFVDLLRRTLGERAFWDGMFAYTRGNAGRSVVSADFQRAMEAASGRDLSALFREWVYGR